MSLFNSLTAADKKVFECVPKQEHWSIMQINNEIIRRHGYTPNYASIALVIKMLTERGLINRKDNAYQQTKVTEPQEKPVSKTLKNLGTIVQREPIPLTLVERMTLMANQLLDMATQLGDMAKEVETLSEPTEELLKLRKLKEALSIFKD